MEKGFVILERELMEMEGYSGHPYSVFECWVDLVFQAEWRPSRDIYIRGNKITIKRGQVAASIKYLSDKWCLSNKTVIKRVNRFEQEGRITVTRSNLVNVLTIVNYNRPKKYTPQYEAEYADYEAVENLSELYPTQQNTLQTTQHCTLQPTHQSTHQGTQQGTQQGTHNINKYNKQIDKQIENEIEKQIDKQENNNIVVSDDTTLANADSIKTDVKPKRKRKSKVEEPYDESIDFDWVMNEWNTICPDFPSVKIITETRKKLIGARVKEMGDWQNAMPIIDRMLRKAAKSPYLRGETYHKFKCTFDWVFKNDTNWVKIDEGNYDDKSPQPTQQNFSTNPNQSYSNNGIPYLDRAALAKQQRDQEFNEYIANKLSRGISEFEANNAASAGVYQALQQPGQLPNTVQPLDAGSLL